MKRLASGSSILKSSSTSKKCCSEIELASAVDVTTDTAGLTTASISISSKALGAEADEAQSPDLVIVVVHVEGAVVELLHFVDQSLMFFLCNRLSFFYCFVSNT